jgi:HAD superfamily hydrolase (TIGR01549 family)
MIEGVLLDFGGTMYEYNPPNYAILADTAREFGMDISNSDPILSIAFQRQEEYINNLLLQRPEYSMKSITDEDWRRGDEILLKTLDIHSQDAKDFIAKRFHERDYYYYNIFPDTHSTLKTLSDMGKKLGVVSNLGAKGVPRRYEMLEESKIRHFFSSIVLSGERGVAKPNPKIFEIAVKELNIDAQYLLHVGDSYYFDVVGARNAGIGYQLLLDTNMGRKCDCKLIKSLKEIIDYVKHFT